MGGYLGIAVMWCLRWLPLSWLRVLGKGLGLALHALVRSRRHVALTNVRLCFPHWSEAQHAACVREHFIAFAQAWLDRSWLWFGSAALIRRRVQLGGALQMLDTDEPTVLFAPHFVGLDVGWTALCLHTQRPLATIYTPQANAVVDRWISRGRQRFGHVTLCRREDGVHPIVSTLRNKGWLYLLPDMNFGASESIFVPFFGVMAATVPSLSRFARLGRARVVPLINRLTPTGYSVEVHAPWTDFPTSDMQADTALMNERLQDFINAMPAQYYWVHQRFKTRPAGEPSLYQRLL